MINYLTGPFNGKFKEVSVRSIHNNFRQSVESLKSGQGGCINIKCIGKKDTADHAKVKRGHIITRIPLKTYA